MLAGADTSADGVIEASAASRNAVKWYCPGCPALLWKAQIATLRKGLR